VRLLPTDYFQSHRLCAQTVSVKEVSERSSHDFDNVNAPLKAASSEHGSGKWLYATPIKCRSAQTQLHFSSTSSSYTASWSQ